MINRAVLTGRLTRNPELKTTQSGLSVSTFTLAVNRQYTNSQGERGADFISCVIWRKAAENFCNFTSKGSLVGIDGRIQTRTYDSQNGQKVYVTEVVVDNFSLLESKKDRESNTNMGNNGGYNNSGNNTSNSNNSAPQDPFSGSGDTIDITDDDLPF
ncbi:MULTISPECIES: single-stranded DNA-binding protein [unclassified Lactobacillus]|uniref:single-stranded DNA-binding protein n=1 Tax=unclassified Lactobacillus TaxID=2620435 RepID=UPI000EFD3B45|nr:MULTISPECIES: single-stranded DNA-binding protein [unclassified Lactobacillus]RMC24445.1 single-stranded DNA-binding protein [Lactobacillus sp. ESL0247]RMC28584.1 single-stranded DNA-binding protein [Lactobacillus sp. ESL0246]RMC31776.1 single-stranded DNA-binding protein [Lactobacillus sp. ESL0245]